MPKQNRTFEFVIEQADSGWMIVNGPCPIGPFFSREQATNLAEGMAQAMRQMGDEVVVRLKE